MKNIILIFLILISSIGFSQTNLEDLVTDNIINAFFTHLDSIGVEVPTYVPCIEQAAQHQANYMKNNGVVGHVQSESGIGDTIIPRHRVYVFCDTNYESNGEICLMSIFKDTIDLINNSGLDVLNQFLNSPTHKKCLESYHEYYGMGISILNMCNSIELYVTVVYGKNLELYNPRFPKHFSINKDAETNYRKLHRNCMIIRD